MARWVVVGGTGYIGGALCRRLVAAGQQVQSVSRASEGPPACQHVSMTLSQNSYFSHLFQSGDRIVYAAGLASRSRCEREPQRARWLNSDCPVALLKCAESAGAASFTYLSSVKALSPPRDVVADEYCGEPALDAYGRSKWRGEQQLLAAKGQCRVNLIRPASVYGCGAGEVSSGGRARRWQGYLRTLGRLAPLLPASGQRSFIFLEDLLSAIILLAEAESCDRQVFIAAEPRFYDLAHIVASLSGGRARSSRRLTSLILGSVRPLQQLPVVRSLMELEHSELYSAARLRSALPWRAEGRYARFLQEAM